MHEDTRSASAVVERPAHKSAAHSQQRRRALLVAVFVGIGTTGIAASYGETWALDIDGFLLIAIALIGVLAGIWTIASLRERLAVKAAVAALHSEVYEYATSITTSRADASAVKTNALPLLAWLREASSRRDLERRREALRTQHANNVLADDDPDGFVAQAKVIYSFTGPTRAQVRS